MYIKHLVGYSMVVGKSLVGSEIYSDLLFYKNEATVASVSGVVDLTPLTRLKRGDFGIGSTRNGGGAFNFNSAYTRPGLYNFAGSESTGAPLGTDGAGTVYRNAYRNIDTPGNNYISDIVVYMQSISSVIEKGGRMFFRSWLAGDTPGEWQELYHSGNSPVGPDGWPLINGPVYGLTAQAGKSTPLVSINHPAALCKLTSTDVAFIGRNGSTYELRAYRWSGSDFVQLGTALTLTGTTGPKCCGLNTTDIAVYDGGVDLLRTYRFNRSTLTWSRVGTELSIVNARAIGPLNATDIALIDSSSALKTYRWNGSTWSVIGTGLTVSTSSLTAITALSSSKIAMADPSSEVLGTYSWSGSAWSLQGNTLGIGSCDRVCISALNSRDIILYTDLSEVVKLYRWDGTNWAQVGTGVSRPIPGYTTAEVVSCALNATDVVISDDGNLNLTVYKTI